MGIARQDFRLMRHHETCSGFIVDTWEDVDENEAGAEFWNYFVIYKYSIPDGREFTQSMSHSGRLKSEFRDLLEPYPIEVEYLPDNPTVSRIKGDGPNSILSWLRSSVGYWAFFPLLLLAIGIYLLWKEVGELRELRKSEKAKACDNGTLYT
jgi:hypothetical protein